MTRNVGTALEWEVGVPILTNRHLLSALLKAIVGGALGCTLLVSFPMAIKGEWDAVLPLLGMFTLVCTAILALALLVSALVFRNRMQTRFRIDEHGVEITLVDQTARRGSRAAMIAGLVLGSPRTAASGMLAISQEQQRLDWTGAFAARFEPQTRSIAFRGGWRTLMRVYCLPENYAAAAAKVEAAMAKGGAAGRVPARSPLGRYLARTLLVIVCSVPLFLLAEEFDLSGFAPFLMLCFALAAVWLVRPLALVVLGTLAWTALELAAALLEQRESMFGGTPYQRYEVVSGDDWALLALSAAGAGALAWLAVQTWRGRIMPALTQDWEDAGDV